MSTEPLTPEETTVLLRRVRTILDNGLGLHDSYVLGDLIATLDAARLSHDRGADVLRDIAENMNHSAWVAGARFGFCGACYARYAVDLPEGHVEPRSVPAPTLPPDALREALDRCREDLTAALRAQGVVQSPRCDFDCDACRDPGEGDTTR